MQVVAKSLYFPFRQFQMVSSNSIDEKAPRNTTIVNLDEYNLPTSKRSYTREINKVLEWCKANTKVFDLSEYFRLALRFSPPSKRNLLFEINV